MEQPPTTSGIVNVEIDLNDLISQWQLPKQYEYELDWSKLQYNNHYKSYEFFESKFPNGYQYLTGFDKIIENIANNAKSPLEEILERYSISNERKTDDTNISKLENCE